MAHPIGLLLPWLVFAVAVGLKTWNTYRMINRQVRNSPGEWSAFEPRWSGTGSEVSRCVDSGRKPRRATDPPGLSRTHQAPQSTETVPRRRACSLRAH